MAMLAMQNYNKESMARVLGTNLRISTKYSIEMSRFLKGRKVSKALNLLDGILAKQIAMPVRIYMDGAGHKKGGVGPGKYPQKIAEEFKRLLNSATKNARAKGLETDNLVISHICVNKGREQYRPTRNRGRTMKLTHVEIVLTPGKTRG